MMCVLSACVSRIDILLGTHLCLYTKKKRSEEHKVEVLALSSCNFSSLFF